MTIITVSLEFNDESQGKHIKITAETVQELVITSLSYWHVWTFFKLQQICIAVIKYNSPESPHE